MKQWELRLAQKEGQIIFVAMGADAEYYVPSTGDYGKTSVHTVKRRTSFILKLNKADCKMVEESIKDESA